MSGPVIVEEERIGLPVNWEPRNHQLEVWDALTQQGRKRVDVVAHRRWGKDEVALAWATWCVKKRGGTYWHLLPEAAQGRRAIWDAVNPHTGKRRIEEFFTEELQPVFKESEMLVEFGNGSTWQVLGADGHDRLVGSSAAGVVFSEWSLARPDAWTYVRPMLLENDGWAMFLWTPRGRNHAARAFESRSRDPEWFCLKHPASETGVFTPEQLAREKRELIAELGSEEEGEARFASEYLVDFDAAAPGTYYASLLAQAERAGRIGRVPYDPALKVDTAWDLGIDDYTAIWFFQQVGREVRAIDYFETQGEGLPAIARRALMEKGYTYGTHHLPHDIMVREIGSGRSRLDTLGSLGVHGVDVGQATDPEERVNAARLLIPVTWFDAEKCAGGLERLRAYRKRWIRATHSYGGPMHDQASHGADAFGEFALRRRGPAASEGRPGSGVRRVYGPQSWMG